MMVWRIEGYQEVLMFWLSRSGDTASCQLAVLQGVFIWALGCYVLAKGCDNTPLSIYVHIHRSRGATMR